MKLKDKIKSYSFWVSLASAVILILKVLGSRFGFTVDESMVSDIFTAMCSILVLMGIIVVPTNPQSTNELNNKSKTNTLSQTDKSLLANQFNSEQENQNENEIDKNPTDEPPCIILPEEQKTETQNQTTLNSEYPENSDIAKQVTTACEKNKPETIITSQNNNCEFLTENKLNVFQLDENNLVLLNENVTEKPINSNENDAEKPAEVFTQSNETTSTLTNSSETDSLLESTIDAKNLSENINQNSTMDNIDNLRATFESERSKLEGNLSDYLSILHEEIEKISQKL